MYLMTPSRSFVVAPHESSAIETEMVTEYLAVIEQDGDAWGAFVPDLPGCVAVAQSREEVELLIAEAVPLHIASMRDQGEPGRFQSVVANVSVWSCRRKSVRASSGVRSSSTSRGRWLSSVAVWSSTIWSWSRRSLLLGKYWRISPLVFSLVGRCHGECGSQK